MQYIVFKAEIRI